jgi:hypothetical protein
MPGKREQENNCNIKQKLILSFTASHVTNSKFLGKHPLGTSTERWEYEINIDHKGDSLLGWKMAGISSTLCPMAEFGVSNVNPSRFPATASVILLVLYFSILLHFSNFS